jgi:hypothetical protein
LPSFLDIPSVLENIFLSLLLYTLVWDSSNRFVKMSEVACSDGIEDSTAQITKWRDDPVQHTVKLHFEFGILTQRKFHMSLLLCVLLSS